MNKKINLLHYNYFVFFEVDNCVYLLLNITIKEFEFKFGFYLIPENQHLEIDFLIN